MSKQKINLHDECLHNLEKMFNFFMRNVKMRHTMNEKDFSGFLSSLMADYLMLTDQIFTAVTKGLHVEDEEHDVDDEAIKSDILDVLTRQLKKLDGKE